MDCDPGYHTGKRLAAAAQTLRPCCSPLGFKRRRNDKNYFHHGLLGDQPREYAPLPPAIAASMGVRKMIAHHLHHLPLSAVGTRYLVNVHLIRFAATPGRPWDTSPPGLHKDGEKYIATHLLGCCGTSGGEVIITDNDKQAMDRFTMRECGECYVFDDDRIWHMLTPIAVREGNEYAYRDTLAFDMLPEGWEPVQ